MKAYSTSKLLVVFVIVLLLSLPYVFAGKPTKPAPEPQEEPVWSVYVPIDNALGLQGAGETPICPGDSCPEVLPEGTTNFYYYNGNLPTTRNFVSDRINFEIQVDPDSGLPSLQVQFDGIEFKCTDDSGCGDIFSQINNPQPSGDLELSKEIHFNFGGLGKSINFTRQKIGSEYPIAGYFGIDSEIPSDLLSADYYDDDPITDYGITNYH